MVYVSEILAWIFFILVVIAIILIVALRLRPQPTTTGSTVNGLGTDTDAFIQASIDQVEQKVGWSKIEPGNDPDRNTCKLYTFPSTMNGDQAVIGQPTLETNTLNALTPIPVSSCIDSDQLVAQQAKRVCQNEDLGCIGFDGRTYLQGQTEFLYQACNQPKACSDTLGLLGLQFNANDLSTLLCVQGQGDNIQGSVTTCDVGQDDQLWRIDRADPETLNNNPNGPYARIISRTNDACLGPLTGTAFAGAAVGLTSCNINSGFVWWVFPPFSSDNGILPQQLVYTTSVAALPKNKKDLNKYLTDNADSLYSLYIDQDNNLTLQPMVTVNPGDPNANLRNTQILDLPLYNLLLQYNPYNQGGISYPAGDRGF